MYRDCSPPLPGTVIAVVATVLLIGAFYLTYDWIALVMCELGLMAPDASAPARLQT